MELHWQPLSQKHLPRSAEQKAAIRADFWNAVETDEQTRDPDQKLCFERDREFILAFLQNVVSDARCADYARLPELIFGEKAKPGGANPVSGARLLPLASQVGLFPIWEVYCRKVWKRKTVQHLEERVSRPSCSGGLTRNALRRNHVAMLFPDYQNLRHNYHNLP